MLRKDKNMGYSLLIGKYSDCKSANRGSNPL